MSTLKEDNELKQYLRGETGREFLQSLPLIEAHIESATILGILTQCCEAILPGVEEKLGVSLCIVAFGSLGRLEFVRNQSDLDPLIIIHPKGKVSPNPENIRSSVLSPLAITCPWLKLDDRSHVIDKSWGDISSCDLKYPVYTKEEILTESDELTQHRRWQLILEARPLYNEQLLNQITDSILPRLKKTAPLNESSVPPPDIDFGNLVKSSPVFYASFENPLFLFKNAHKYWKTRFLREFYAFSTNISFVLGWYLQRHGELLASDYLRAPTAIKIMRATRFARELESEAKANQSICDHFIVELERILAKWHLTKGPLLLFGRDYTTEPARLLHGLLNAVLARFANCWDKLYEGHVLSNLDMFPKSQTNFDARFRKTIENPQVEQVIEELIELRKSYLKYMSATAEVIDNVFLKGRLWSYHTVPLWLEAALKPFYDNKF